MDQALTPFIPDLPHEKAEMLARLRLAYASIIPILTNQSSDFAWLINEWRTFCENSQREANPFKKSYVFFEIHGGNIVDKVDRFLIEAMCASELSDLLYSFQPDDGQSMETKLDTSNKLFGLGCSILAYHTLGISLGISGEEACEYEQQGLLFCAICDHKQAWDALKARTLLTPQQFSRFQHSHRISCSALNIPRIEILPGPHLEVCYCHEFLHHEFIKATETKATETGNHPSHHRGCTHR